MPVVRPHFPRAMLAALTAIVCLIGCRDDNAPSQNQLQPASVQTPATTALVSLGKQLFFDRSLSASGRMSCATCHDPHHAYGPPNRLAAQFGGPKLNLQGARAVPSLRYVLNRTPFWSKPYIENAAERTLEGNEPPSGGFGWDGRFNNLHEQAAFPLLAPNEMANKNVAEVAGKIARAAYADDFRKLFGADAFADPERAFRNALLAIERFELDDASFHPYSSKFDAWLEGKARLTEQESRGLKLFDDPQRGNCSTCHSDTKGANGSHPLFTDFQFETLAVPRNPELTANANPHYFDLGVCGPVRGDQHAQREYCGMFKTPGLRNVASRGAFFHNGRFHDLKQALRFYVQRDTDPASWYPMHGGKTTAYDDLPADLRVNVDTTDRPLTRKRGEQPMWNDAEIEDVIAFLKTLDDADLAR